MKICLNCVHVDDASDLGFEKCKAEQNLMEPNMINGHRDARYLFCQTQRSGGFIAAYLTESCGPQARWFKPKEK